MKLEGKKIAVGLSGGVDSSVAAYLLKEAGYDVFALFMQNWHDITGTLHGECEWEEDLSVAKMVAKKIGIPFKFIDLSDTYRKDVVDYMFSEYSKGRTPNPDVLCNSKIKFDAFLKAAQSMGADYVATGHYCRGAEFVDENGNEVYRILAGVDGNKDQSYFLCQLNQEQLSKAIFPIGDIEKPRVREIARQAGLPSAEKKDSQGICFVGKVDLPVFLQQKLASKQGNVIEIFPEFYENLKGYPGYAIPSSEVDETSVEELSKVYHYKESDGKKIGTHIGAQYYTIGQRKGLNIGGHKEPIFIIDIVMETNTIYVGEGHHHPGLSRKALRIDASEVHWIREDLKMTDGETRDYLVRIRYRQPLQKAKLICKGGDLYILFEEHQRGITPGQFAVWYSPDDLEMIGSGVISE
ncbi:MAG: tRNA 2-thiouridine(34) synthase MnmA [Bacteroidales bacterium]|nr:tRNA 2-thiouridine(34) synthase MnmA [Bacteroidales bacterium]MBQ5882609.1 tRNA 2-thiouridine(34) synthase MnmA [Bacteroidales bacterium]